MKKQQRLKYHNFVYALRGIALTCKREMNMKIHIISLITVITAAVILQISAIHWCILLLTISSVLCTEIINTAIEFLGDAITEEHNDFIKNAKDIAAGAVLTAAVTAVIIGLIIFTPYIAGLLK